MEAIFRSFLHCYSRVAHVRKTIGSLFRWQLALPAAYAKSSIKKYSQPRIYSYKKVNEMRPTTQVLPRLSTVSGVGQGSICRCRSAQSWYLYMGYPSAIDRDLWYRARPGRTAISKIGIARSYRKGLQPSASSYQLYSILAMQRYAYAFTIPPTTAARYCTSGTRSVESATDR